MAYTKYSLTPANNNAAPPDGAPEGMLPSAVNDTMRDMMAQIRDVGDGIRGGTYTMTAPVITGGSITGVALSGNTFTNPVITGGSINGTAIGGSTAAAGAFTTLSASGAFSANGGATLGDASGDALTINSSAVSIPNGLNFDSNTFVIDATNNRVGIGTASPNYALHIAGQSAYLTSGASTALTFIDINSAYGTIRTGIDASGVGYFGPVSNFALALYTNNSERLRIDTSGNVGIGTSSPTALLDLYSASGVQLQLHNATTGTSSSDGSRIQLSGSDLFIVNRESASIQLYTNDTERMRIDSSGNVLVGRTSVTGTNCRLNVQLSGTTASGYTAASNAGISLDAGTATNGVINLVGGAELGVYRSNSSGAFDVGIGFGDNSNRILRFDTAGTERMRIDSSGNVGIGTSSPQIRLQSVASGSGLQEVFRVGNSQTRGAGVGVKIGFQPNNDFVSNGLIGAAVSAVNTSGSSANDISLVFSTGSGGAESERMRITSGGDVTIGSTGTFGKLGSVQGGNNVNFRAENGSSSFTSTNIWSTLTGGSNINTTAVHYAAYTTTGNVFVVYGNGNVVNTNNSYGTLSDAKLKENIVDATPKLDKINQLQVRNFNLIGEDLKQIGFVAQEFEQVFPSMVEESADKDKDGNDLGTTTKTIKTTVLIPILVKAIQEQQAMIEDLKAEVALLKSK